MCVYMCMCVCVRVYMRACVCVHECMRACVCMHASVSLSMCVCACTRVPMHECAHSCALMNTQKTDAHEKFHLDVNKLSSIVWKLKATQLSTSNLPVTKNLPVTSHPLCWPGLAKHGGQVL